LWLSERMVEQGQSGHRLHLRMGRKDIASLLGVAHETVSRAFSTLSEAGLVQVDNRSVDVLDRTGLQSLARNTRAQAAAETRAKAGAPGVDGHAGRACQAAASPPPALWCDGMLQQGLPA
jgi:DNA-binding transcriptional ArsR family regulator